MASTDSSTGADEARTRTGSTLNWLKVKFPGGTTIAAGGMGAVLVLAFLALLANVLPGVSAWRPAMANETADPLKIAEAKPTAVMTKAAHDAEATTWRRDHNKQERVVAKVLELVMARMDQHQATQIRQYDEILCKLEGGHPELGACRDDDGQVIRSLLQPPQPVKIDLTVIYEDEG